jgi:hypothetical protein
MAKTTPPQPPTTNSTEQQRAAALPHAKPKERDEMRQPHPPQEEIDMPPNPASASCAGPYASRPDRDPWPAPMACLSRAAGAGLDDSAYFLQSGAVAGAHTPGAHHLAADGVTDVEDDDHVAPPPRELEMPEDDARFCYPIERDPCVGGGMATAAPAAGVTLSPGDV